MSNVSPGSCCADGSRTSPEVFSFEEEMYRMVFAALLKSFGLDVLMIRDREGGDVDTIKGVRNGVEYKNHDNAADYESIPLYAKGVQYRNAPQYRQMKRQARETFQKTGQPLEDAYTGGDIYFAGKSKGVHPSKKGEVDHVIPCNEIHHDPGRVLAGLDGVELANADENLHLTNKSLNASMGDVRKTDYVRTHPELPKETKRRILAIDKNARRYYEDKIDMAYYGGRRFFKDTADAALAMGKRMALREVMGFIMAEVVFAVRAALRAVGDECADRLRAIGRGVRDGFAGAVRKWRHVLDHFGQGMFTGLLSSIATTVCNIFFTTAKNTVRLIRQASASLCEAAKVVFLNSGGVPLRVRIRAALKILSTGAGVVLGVFVEEAVRAALLPYISVIPMFGQALAQAISTFCGLVVSGFLACALIRLIDSHPFRNAVTAGIRRTADDYRRQAELFESCVARMAGVDTVYMKRRMATLHKTLTVLEATDYGSRLGVLLSGIAVALDVAVPWGRGSFAEFMSYKHSYLRFEA